jgi:hypothetical protein
LVDKRGAANEAAIVPHGSGNFERILCELTNYLDANADSLPDYGARYGAARGQPKRAASLRSQNEFPGQALQVNSPRAPDFVSN